MHPSRPLVALLLAAALSAQTYVVSPVGYANQAGNSNNTFPLYYQAGRYQQVHADLAGTPRVMLGMSLRKSSTTLSSMTARTISVTVLMCNSSLAAATGTFASNYIGTPTTVLPKTSVNCPDWTFSQGTPEPWSIVIPFTTPFPYPGVNDLLWEFQIDSNTATGGYYADAASASDTLTATLVPLGVGCRVGSNTRNMTQSMRIYTTASTKLLNLTSSVSAAPPSAPALLIVGPVNPNLTIPGLCEKLFTLPTWQFPMSTNSSGTGTLPLVSATHDPAWAGLKLYCQTFAPDAGQTGIPLAGSNGTEATLPGFAVPVNVARIYASGSSSATSGTIGRSYGLIVRFTNP
jgi:hypothetical protein